MLQLVLALLLLLGSTLSWWLHIPRIHPHGLPRGLHLRQLDPALRWATCRLQDISDFEEKRGNGGDCTRLERISHLFCFFAMSIQARVGVRVNHADHAIFIARLDS